MDVFEDILYKMCTSCAKLYADVQSSSCTILCCKT